MYGIIFVIIIAGIVITSSNNKEELTTISNPSSDMEMPKDAVHQGMNGMGEDTPSKNNVREDFGTKLEEYKLAHETNPNDTLAMKNYAQTLGMSHQTEKAIELYEKILAIDPNRTDILLAEGLAFYNNQNYQMAEVVTKKIIALDDKNLEAKYNLGVMAAVQGREDDAKKIWEKLAEKYPNEEVGKLAADALVQLNQ
jgi:tetratricopeptide (TPR) repeat protein